jgi:hypothetical protein
MTPLLVIKTANGFAIVKYTGELPTVDLSSLLCFGDLTDSYSYRHDGALAAIRKHFEEPPQPAEPAKLEAVA